MLLAKGNGGTEYGGRGRFFLSEVAAIIPAMLRKRHPYLVGYYYCKILIFEFHITLIPFAQILVRHNGHRVHSIEAFHRSGNLDEYVQNIGWVKSKPYLATFIEIKFTAMNESEPALEIHGGRGLTMKKEEVPGWFLFCVFKNFLTWKQTVYKLLNHVYIAINISCKQQGLYGDAGLVAPEC